MTLVSFAAITASPAALAQTIFINEIHYHNGGADTGETIEIAGPQGTDLAGWTIVLYNESSTQRSVYGTINLTGVIAETQEQR